MGTPQSASSLQELTVWRAAPVLCHLLARTVTGNDAVAVFALPSVALHVTLVLPILKRLPDIGVHPTGHQPSTQQRLCTTHRPSQLSTTEVPALPFREICGEDVAASPNPSNAEAGVPNAHECRRRPMGDDDSEAQAPTTAISTAATIVSTAATITITPRRPSPTAGLRTYPSPVPRRTPERLGRPTGEDEHHSADQETRWPLARCSRIPPRHASAGLVA